MEEINYLMMAAHNGKREGHFFLSRRPGIQRFEWQETVVSLHLIPGAWAAGRLEEYVTGLVRTGKRPWLAPEAQACIPDYAQPFPGPDLAAFLLKRLPFREYLIVLTGEGGLNDSWWQERFLEECFADLNGLYLVGEKSAVDSTGFDEWLYEQSGLPVCCTDRLPETDGRKTAVVELRSKGRPPYRKLPPASLYLDLTSDPEKQRILREKRTDISYMSARNYLDTTFKARYNAF